MGYNVRSRVGNEKFKLGDAVLSPDPEVLATGLVPATNYTSSARYEFEIENVFQKSWLCIGREVQASAVGDYFVFDAPFAKTSIIVVRDRDETLHAFHNTCMHRGMKLLWDARGHVGNFRCPYHAWTYATDGRLIGVPERACFPQLDMANNGLREIALASWEGFVFINLDPDCKQSLDEYLGEFGTRLSGMSLGSYSHCVRLSYEVESNWKAGFDSQCEGYHVPTLHKNTVREFLSSKDNPYVRYDWVEFAGPHRSGAVPGNAEWRPSTNKPVQSFAMAQTAQMTALEDSGVKQDDVGGLARHPGLNLNQDPLWTNEHFGIFPNLIFHPTSSGWFTAQFWPLGPGRHLWESRYYFMPPKSLREEFGIAQAIAFTRDVLMEDFIAVERQQKSLESGALTHLRFSDQEMMPRHQAAVLAAIEKQVLGLAPAFSPEV
ncbi:MAG: aromatic ring-hydroxylating dioxygenase subunit alpha [Pseudomonadota bacterium]|nr:aromatic ring-hydroxylating dioxygenase subunit alpha [Pseudomonadota bacterium]